LAGSAPVSREDGSHQARRGAVAARQAHNLEVSGSNPLAATKAARGSAHSPNAPTRGRLSLLPSLRLRLEQIKHLLSFAFALTARGRYLSSKTRGKHGAGLLSIVPAPI